MKTTNLHLLSGKTYTFHETPSVPITVQFNPEAGTYIVSDVSQTVVVPVSRVDRISTYDISKDKVVVNK